MQTKIQGLKIPLLYLLKKFRIKTFLQLIFTILYYTIHGVNNENTICKNITVTAFAVTVKYLKLTIKSYSVALYSVKKISAPSALLYLITTTGSEMPTSFFIEFAIPS